MKPLLKISHVPIKIERSMQNAALRHSTEPAKMNVTRQKGSQNIQTTPAKVNLDQSEARASVGSNKTVGRMISDNAAEGTQTAREVARNYAEGGNQLIDSHGRGQPLIDVAAANSGVGQMKETALAFIPSTGPEMMPQEGSISFDYQMDKLTFDWNVQTRPELEYIPPKIEFNVTQYPELVIEYLGEPIYVPASADPNYKGEA